MPQRAGRLCRWRTPALVGVAALAVSGADPGVTALTDGAYGAGAAAADPAAGGESLSVISDAGNRSSTSAGGPVTPKPPPGSFDYHKPTFPLDWKHDGLSLSLASLGLIIAASGGIGGGGMLVPLFMLVLGFRPKHAIALSNFTILGGSIANTALNAGKRHPELPRGLIDWDLIIIMEPLTIFGAVLGSLLSKVLPNIVLTVSLVLILAFMGQRTLKKGLKMWFDESRSARLASATEMLDRPFEAACEESPAARCHEVEAERPYVELQSDSETPAPQKRSMKCKIALLTACFVGTCVLTVLKGGGHFVSPMGFECGSLGYWMLYFGAMPWVLAFALYFRNLLVAEFDEKVRSGHTFVKGEVQWDRDNTVKYPVYCAIAGLLAGLFGVGGGIVKGPLMLEMGILPSVASASAAAMILYTSAAASTSYVVFGLLHVSYGVLFFCLGVVCTAFGQYTVGQWVKKHKRQSPIVLSIGLVISLSSVCVAANTLSMLLGPEAHELFQSHNVCNLEA